MFYLPTKSVETVKKLKNLPSKKTRWEKVAEGYPIEYQYIVGIIAGYFEILDETDLLVDSWDITIW